MTKRLIEIDDARLDAARLALGTSTIKDTVNAALDRVASPLEQRVAEVEDAFDVLASIEFSESDRAQAWA